MAGPRADSYTLSFFTGAPPHVRLGFLVQGGQPLADPPLPAADTWRCFPPTGGQAGHRSFSKTCPSSTDRRHTNGECSEGHKGCSSRCALTMNGTLLSRHLA